MKKTKLLDKLPPSFDVGWAKFEFKFKKDLKDSDGSKCYGMTDFNECVITLDSGMSDKVAHPTIIHEVCHALMETFGLGGDHDKDEDLVVSGNEFITEAACRCFLMFKNLNPELWNTLFEEYYE
jgi:Zn-dependent peptidase ImmA (M78 family)